MQLIGVYIDSTSLKSLFHRGTCRIRTTIGRSPILKAAVSRIVLELRAIDSDLFGAGWGRRIGSQLYEGLLMRPESKAEFVEANGQGSEETRPPTGCKEEQSLPKEAEGAEHENNDKRRQGEW